MNNLRYQVEIYENNGQKKTVGCVQTLQAAQAIGLSKREENKDRILITSLGGPQCSHWHCEQNSNEWKIGNPDWA